MGVSSAKYSSLPRMRCFSNRSWLICLLFCLSFVEIASKSSKSSSEELYLYHGVEGSEAVDDYQDRDNTHPDFLAKPQGMGPRLVEFYAPWCPHCRHFRDHYIKLAEQVHALADDQGIKDVQVHAISCVAHRQLCKNYGIKGYPRVYVFPAGSPNATTTLQYWKVHPLQVINVMAGADANDKHPSFEVVAKKPAEKKTLRQNWFGWSSDEAASDKPELQSRTKQNVFDDAYKSLDFVIRNGIFMTNAPMDNITKAAFSEWIDLLVDTMPPTWSQAQKPLAALQKNIENVTKSEEMLVKVWGEHASKPAKRWSDSCSHGESGAGYTCGLWELFHIMTVGASEWNLMLIDPHDHSQLDHEHAAKTLRNFVEHFFGCEVCRVHFVSAFDECFLEHCSRIKRRGDDRHDYLQFPIWLFEMHNAVNTRLLHEKAERDGTKVSPGEEVEVLYPSRKECPACWHPDGSWDQDNVYSFLRLDYWPEDSVSGILRDELYSAEKTDTDDDIDPPQSYLHYLSILVIVAFVATLHFKRQELYKTGHHKRIS